MLVNQGCSGLDRGQVMHDGESDLKSASDFCGVQHRIINSSTIFVSARPGIDGGRACDGLDCATLAGSAVGSLRRRLQSDREAQTQAEQRVRSLAGAHCKPAAQANLGRSETSSRRTLPSQGVAPPQQLADPQITTKDEPDSHRRRDPGPHRVRTTPGARSSCYADRYELIGLLGVGGMGSVYRVHDRVLDDDVALKILRKDLADSPPAIARFHREVRLARRINHHNVVRIFDVGEGEGEYYYTMECVVGDDSVRHDAPGPANGRVPQRSKSAFRLGQG